MGTAPLTTPWQVLRIISLTNMNKFLATLLLAPAISAEADPYLLGYHGLGYAGYPGYAGYGYALPYAAAGYASVSPSASLTPLGAAPAAVPAVEGAYAGAGRYVANSAGVVHVAKREAEADPYYYGGYGLGYRTYGGYGGYGLGYGRGYFYGQILLGCLRS